MPLSLFELYNVLPAFLLVLFRVSGLMVTAPILSSPVLPVRFKTLLAVALSAALFPVIMPQVPASITAATAVVGLIGELALGVFLGFGLTLLFSGLQLGVQLAGQQAGLGLGEVFDPMLGSEISAVAQLYYFVALLIFLAVDGHHALIRALLDSFAAIPPLQFGVTGHLVDLIVEMAGESFAIAIRVAGPVMLTLLLAFLTLGFISRTVPQLNILTVGFPLKLMVALLVMAVTVVTLQPVLLEGLAEFLDLTRQGLGLAAAN